MLRGRRPVLKAFGAWPWQSGHQRRQRAAVLSTDHSRSAMSRPPSPCAALEQTPRRPLAKRGACRSARPGLRLGAQSQGLPRGRRRHSSRPPCDGSGSQHRPDRTEFRGAGTAERRTVLCRGRFGPHRECRGTPRRSAAVCRPWPPSTTARLLTVCCGALLRARDSVPSARSLTAPSEGRCKTPGDVGLFNSGGGGGVFGKGAQLTGLLLSHDELWRQRRRKTFFRGKMV